MFSRAPPRLRLLKVITATSLLSFTLLASSSSSSVELICGLVNAFEESIKFTLSLVSGASSIYKGAISHTAPEYVFRQIQILSIKRPPFLQSTALVMVDVVVPVVVVVVVVEDVVEVVVVVVVVMVAFVVVFILKFDKVKLSFLNGDIF